MAVCQDPGRSGRRTPADLRFFYSLRPFDRRSAREGGRQSLTIGDQTEQEAAEEIGEFEQQQSNEEQAEQEGKEWAEQRPLLKETRNAAWGHAKDSRESGTWPASLYGVFHTGSTMRQHRRQLQPPHFAPF
jgi:hypothetical protein